MGITNANIKKLNNGWKRSRESRKEMAYLICMITISKF
jgi:hypothetical protein